MQNFEFGQFLISGCSKLSILTRIRRIFENFDFGLPKSGAQNLAGRFGENSCDEQESQSYHPETRRIRRSGAPADGL